MRFSMKQLFFGLFFSCVHLTNGSRILFMPVDHVSHINMHSKAGAALKAAGHEVWLLTSESELHKSMIQKAGINPLFIKHSKDASMQDAMAQVLTELLSGGSYSFTVIYDIIAALDKFCGQILGNTKLMQEIEKINFDLAIVDGVPEYQCAYTIPYRLSTPYITLTPLLDPWNVGVPAMPSMEPTQMLPFTNRMTFFQRVINLLATTAFTFMVPRKDGEEFMVKYVPNKVPKSFAQLSANSEMWLLTIEARCLEYPRISGSNYQFIGGLSADKPKPLPEHIAKFVDNSKDGIIVMSFGSIKALAATYMLDPPPNLSKIIRQHTFWMLSCALREDTPMWRGWNSMVHYDELPQQIVGYMENIDLPSTRLDVVQETFSNARTYVEEIS